VERLEQITAAESTAPGRPKDGSRWLRERSVDAFSLADQSLSRCMAFTHGYGFVGLVQALDSIFASILQSTNEHISTDNRLLSMDSSALSGGDDLSDMDYTTQDWSRIQMYLRLLGATHGFSDRLGTFESKMRATLVLVSENIRTAQSDAFSPARSLSGTPKGALADPRPVDPQFDGTSEPTEAGRAGSSAATPRGHAEPSHPTHDPFATSECPNGCARGSFRLREVLSGLASEDYPLPLTQTPRVLRFTPRMVVFQTSPKSTSGWNGRADGDPSSRIFHLSE
jgi:hypothetical protein